MRSWKSICEVLSVLGPDYTFFMDDNAWPHRAHTVDEFHEEEYIRRMVWPSRSSYINPAEYVWDGLGKAISQRSSHPPEIKRSTFGKMDIVDTNVLIHTLINSMAACCGACTAVHSDHIPY
ncbi:DDE_3 domain-containing protein [Trichonephila clavipes]|uniref:DDE_3 domain-containing protein n=1 Tax=Trichonephila clavipes TaxID=2585209 RepID=A0A8X6S6B4_TRICX|nr:DDE_3 domain-containing protein [Trichonephila clavipes]